MTAIGIDFGTTNSAAAIHTGSGAEVIRIGEPPADWAAMGFDKVLPSVVALDESRNLLFGWEAKSYHTDKKFEAIKRLFKEEETTTAGEETFFVEEVAAALFRYIRTKVLSAGIDFASSVITVPANSRGLARYRTKVCAGIGGIEPLALINEPTAAAMAYASRHVSDGQTILVFDLGGGTLDVTVLEPREGVFFEQASKGIGRLGGLDFDAAILREIKAEVPQADRWTPIDTQRIRLEVEKAKIRLSEGKVDETVIVDEALPGFRLTRPRFNEITRHLVERAAEPIERVMQDLRLHAGDIDLLLMVGGSSKIPAVRQFVAELVGREPATGVDPMTAVAEGAAVAAAILTGDLDDRDFFVSTEHALGTIVADPSMQRLRFAPIIPRNQKLPARQRDLFSPVTDYQDSVRVQVVEGDPDKPLDHPDNQILTEFDVPFDPPRPASEAGFELTYHYDTDGLLHIDVVDAMTGDQLTDRVTISFKGAKTGRDLVDIAKRVHSAVDEGIAVGPATTTTTGHDPRSKELLGKARTKVLPFLEDEQAAELTTLVQKLEQAEGDGVAAAQDALEAELRKYSYLF